MSDITQDFPRINVRDLILYFEQKSVGDNIKYRHRRSKSIGTINENTTVRCDDLQTLKDVEEALAFTDSCMKTYFAYNKDLHVSFSEQLLIYSHVQSILKVKQKKIEKKEAHH
nr:unnamed protein product [Callosobruchus analis]